MFWFQATKKKKRPRVVLPQQHKVIEEEPCSDLWDLVLDMDWPRVMDHAHEHPVDAEWQDGHWHETPLYLACQHNPPVEAVRALVQAFPAAVRIPSRANQDLPIHIACRYQVSKDILQELLLRDFPVTAIEQTRWGRTPLMVLWEFRSTTVLEEEEEEEMFWNKIVLLLSAVARYRQDPRYTSQIPKMRVKTFRNQSSKEENATSDEATTCEPKSLLLVHAAVSLGALSCPVEVLDYILKQFPEGGSQWDPWGQIPLHIAVGPASWSSNGRKYKPREQDFVQLLLNVYPDGARQQRLNDDRYPLHAALANRHTWTGGIQALFHAAPEVLLIRDPVTRWYPFQLAAIPVGDNMTVELDTIYHLLRSQPNVLGFFDLAKNQKKETAIAGNDRLSYPCPRFVQDTLLGTLTAVFIGSIAGMVFAD
jgi:hypothetical protein